MPHLTLEYTSNIQHRIDFQDLFGQLHQVMAELAGTRIENFKSRAMCREAYHVGAGSGQEAFIHLEIRLLSGRSPEQKAHIGQRCLDVLQETWSPFLADLDPQITVELVGIERDSYFKGPPAQA